MYVAPTESETLAACGPDLEVLIDELANGQCSQDEFVERVVQCEARDEDAVWEMLALLDQHFRRKRIDRETFVALKARLQRHSLGDPANGKPAKSQPKPRVRPEPASPPPSGARPTAPGPARAEDGPADDGLPSLHAVEPHAPSAPMLLEASFHREVRAGDLLCGRYRAVEILRRREWMTLIEAVDEPKAELPGIRQRVALHVLDENLTQDTLLMQRIGKLQTLSHPAITRILDVEEDCGSLVLVTEFFRGVALRDLLERRTDRRVPIQSALAIVRALAGALAYCHGRGIAHGDLTTANVLITDLGDARLQGFELRAQSHAVQPSADRMAFARLAYELLAGTAEPLHALGTTPLSKLRAPPGITRAQWRVLRETLAGREGSADTGILAAFGADAAASEPVLLQDDTGSPVLQQRRPVREWLAAGVVAAILGSGLYLYLRELPVADPQPSRTVDAMPLPRQEPVEAPFDVVTVDTAAVQAGASTTAATAATVNPPRGASGTTPASTSNAMSNAVMTTPPQSPPVPRPSTRASIDLASTYAWVDTTEPVARIWVTRRGAPNREVTFRWWTETGTAQVDRDFRGIEPRVGVIPEGSRGVELLVPLMPDPSRREPRTFYVKIDEPGPGADLGTRTLMQVAIVPPGYPAARDTPATTQNLTVTAP